MIGRSCGVCEKTFGSPRGRANHERWIHPEWQPSPELRRARLHESHWGWRKRQGRSYDFLAHANIQARAYGHAPIPVKTRLPEGPCVYCGGEAGGWDHVVPLGRGGPHAVENLVPACFDCNRRKGTRYIDKANREAA